MPRQRVRNGVAASVSTHPPIIWLCARYHKSGAIEVRGAYASEERAVARCRMPNDFVGPLAIGADTPEGAVTWPGAYYPLAAQPSHE